MKYKIRVCALAKKEHESCSRCFAHVFHKKNTICVARSVFDLPTEYLAGILLHELGHLCFNGLLHSERDADDEGGWLAGVRIERKTYRGKKRLEFVRTGELKKALRVLFKETDLGKDIAL